MLDKRDFKTVILFFKSFYTLKIIFFDISKWISKIVQNLFFIFVLKFRIILLALLWSVFIICFCSGIYYLCYIYLCKTWKFYLTFYAGKTNISSFDFFFAFMICDISYYVFNILCASFHIWKFYFSKYFQKKDIKLFFTGGEKSILNFSKLLVLYFFWL